MCKWHGVFKFVTVMWYTLHAYGSLHACLPPLDIRQVTPQPASSCSINASEHYCNTPGNDGEGTPADTCAVTGHQQAAVCPQTVHVVLCACVRVCLKDQLTLTTVAYVYVLL